MREGPGAAAAMLCSVVGAGGTGGGPAPPGVGGRRREKVGKQRSSDRREQTAAGPGPVTLSWLLVSVQTRQKLEMGMGGSSGAVGRMGRVLLNLESYRS